MKDEYDFSSAKRGAIASNKGKTRITIMLDDAVIEAARARAENAGTGYQTVINNLLRQALVSQDAHNLAPVSKKCAKTLQVISNGISVSEVEALEQQLIALAGELNRMLATPKPTKPKGKSVP
ncbi:BrnA antitoxin family protein [Pseudomonas orientalis]|uniref:BrnA antitoxin family protein n=1 Tax=Pseudomonas orientalis TaxID=76758 RepID=UPI0032096F13